MTSYRSSASITNQATVATTAATLSGGVGVVEVTVTTSLGIEASVQSGIDIDGKIGRTQIRPAFQLLGTEKVTWV